MNTTQLLNRLEHNLLTMQMDDIEPLFVLYRGTIKDIEEVTLDQILEALVKLVNLGFTECKQKKWGKWRPCKNLCVDVLKRRFAGLSEEKKREYPLRVSEYYFDITEKGRLEEKRDVYDIYYRDAST